MRVVGRFFRGLVSHFSQLLFSSLWCRLKSSKTKEAEPHGQGQSNTDDDPLHEEGYRRGAAGHHHGGVPHHQTGEVILSRYHNSIITSYERFINTKDRKFRQGGPNGQDKHDRRHCSKTEGSRYGHGGRGLLVPGIGL